MLGGMIKDKGGRPGKNRSQDVTGFSDLGIDKMTAHRWQTEFLVPESDFETYIREAREAR
jgi:hypothetical protein